jgi:hypothetical protein|nr:MAG TPA: hypothetical protein [Caudoviricetes sp.]
MASKQKERVGEVQRAKGILYDVIDGKYKLLKKSYTKEETLLLLRTLGKRAQTRLKTLSTYFNERGKRYTGEINPIYDRYKGYDIRYQGVSMQALQKKVSTAIEILNAKQSTYTGYRQLQNRAFEKMKENHPKLKDLTFEQWKAMTTYMGAWQSAHEGEQYDSEQLLAYARWTGESSGYDTLSNLDPENVDLDSWFLDVQREGTSGQWLDLNQDFDDI